MSEFVYIGKIVNTHGIRGEIRLLSKFSYKNRIFKPGKKIYVGRDRVEEVITSYRVHKCFDMITLSGYTNINEVLKYKGALCYAKREDLDLTSREYLEEDLIGLDVYINQEKCGTVLRLERVTEKNRVLWISYQGKEIPVPFVDAFVDVLITEGKVFVKPIEGLLS